MQKPVIYFNNSSLEDIACGRRYYLRNIKGAKVPRDPKLTLGVIFHKFAEIVRPEDNVFTLTMMKRPQINYGETLPSTINQLANLAVKSSAQNHTRPTSAREWFFFIDETHLLEPELQSLVTLFRVGTMDQVVYNEADDCVEIPDYKTTSSKMDAKFFENYAVKTQKFFYVDALYQIANHYPDQFPLKDDRALAAAKAGKIKWQYIFVDLNGQNIIAHPSAYLHDSELAAFRVRLSERRNLAAFYHTHQDLISSSKDGAFFNHCYFCPFRSSICSLNDPDKEADAINKWRYGFAPYDPHHRDE